MRWTLERVARALALTPPANPAAAVLVNGVSIDSRTIASGELFFAVRGARLDGHDFVQAALAAGATAAVVERSRFEQFPLTLRDRLLPVPDTLRALGLLGREVRRAWATEGRTAGSRRLAAITGSTGKTTTKEILAALVGSRMPVLHSEGNLNNAFGLPLTLCRLEDHHRAAVVEVGMSRPGELADLAKIAEPDLGVVTNVAPVHLEFFSSVEEISLAKRELIHGLVGPEPIAVLNADDSRVSRFADGFRGRVLTFGRGAGAQFRAESIEDWGLEGTAFDFVARGVHVRLALPLLGVHNVMNALAALAAASVWDIGAEEEREVFRKLSPTGHRGRVLRFGEGFVVVDDSYNSNPAALASVIDWLAGFGSHRRRILAAGEMRELGSASASLHREAGRWAAGRIDWILGVQGDAEQLVRGAIEAGHPASQAKFFADCEEVARFLAEFVRPGDLVVLKGSRTVRMERIVAVLAARHGPAEPEPAGTREPQ
jgi:UDP-N-acetylmuramoyl-tripeptide--D-alanyl-D-alanine ligase